MFLVVTQEVLLDSKPRQAAAAGAELPWGGQQLSKLGGVGRLAAAGGEQGPAGGDGG